MSRIVALALCPIACPTAEKCRSLGTAGVFIMLVGGCANSLFDSLVLVLTCTIRIFMYSKKLLPV